MKNSKQDSFWTSYSDLMTSLFFVMLVLFVVCIIFVGRANKQLEGQLDESKRKNMQYENILQLQEQFKELSESTILEYDEEKKMFYAKDFQNIEIFFTDDDNIKNDYLPKVDSVGKDIQTILKSLSHNKQFKYLLVIEGNAAIPWEILRAGTYNPDSQYAYELSYRRAIALYNRWQKYDFRKYNTEIIIAGSGFNGINRDVEVEENNKRFVIQIIPKVQRPENAK